MVLQKSLYTIPELKTAIQSGIEAISTETVIKDLNNFALHLQIFYGLREHYKE
jgi:hypothetical protein